MGGRNTTLTQCIQYSTKWPFKLFTPLLALQYHTPQHQAFLILHVVSKYEPFVSISKSQPIYSHLMSPSPYGPLTTLQTISQEPYLYLPAHDRQPSCSHGLVESKMPMPPQKQAHLLFELQNIYMT